MSNTTKSGKVTGTGAALNIPLGFKPDYVKVYNHNDAGALYPTMEWFKGMTDAHGLKSMKVIDSGATGNASQNRVTVNGISMYAGDKSNAPGFTLGADADMNVVGEEVYYFASRNIDGA